MTLDPQPGASGVLVAWKGAVGADALQLGRGAADEAGMALEDVLSVAAVRGGPRLGGFTRP